MLPERIRSYLDTARVPIAVSATEGDTPLIFVNDRFCDLTGYSREEVIGRNCRFLQGPDTKNGTRDDLHAFVHDPDRDSGRFPVLNYRKDGTAFDNYVYMTRLRDASGQTQFILASQFDMTTALRRSKIGENDEGLGQALSDMDRITQDFGLAMMGSAQMISDSVALMAKLSLDDEQA